MAKKKAAESINRDDLALKVLRNFRIIYGAVRSHFREVERSCGISGSQLWILQELGNTPGIGVSELGERLSIHQSTCSQLVEKLVKKGLVNKVRLTNDQRRVGLALSAEGKKVMKRAPGPAEGILPRALMNLPPSALQSLDHRLHMVIDQLEDANLVHADTPLADL